MIRATTRRVLCRDSAGDLPTDLMGNSNGGSVRPTASTSPHREEEGSDSKMACYHPKPAWQAKLGGKLSFSYVRGWRVISVPCSTCHGCVKAHAQAWAFRCHLEGTRLPHNAFATLTYDDAHLPWTLQVRDLQLFLKSLRQRADRPVRFFASGEYGSKTQRPHYHVILFGFDALGAAGQAMVQDSWGRGQAKTDALTPARIAYCAGYTDKKVTDRRNTVDRCDPETGEVWQPPFINMSRRPGIGSHARQWKSSWRSFAIHDGHKLAVPRFLHNAWRETATEQELEELQAERDAYIHSRDNSIQGLEAAEKIALAKQKLSSERREQTAQKRAFQTAEMRRFLGVNTTGENTT